jgi:hypothetical protein
MVHSNKNMRKKLHLILRHRALSPLVHAVMKVMKNQDSEENYSKHMN